jgi:hypothetical protein
MLAEVEVPIVIVGFGNADDIVKCLTAIGEQRGCPKIGVFICENGGAGAFDALIGALSKPGGRARAKRRHWTSRVFCAFAGSDSPARRSP